MSPAPANHRQAGRTVPGEPSPFTGLGASLHLRGLALFALLAASLSVGAASTGAPAAAPDRFVHEGTAVDFALLPADAAAPTNSPTPRAGEPARLRFTLADTTTGRPLTRAHPAAWLSRRDANPAQPRTCAQKIQEFLGGSIFAKADLDLNAFHVVTLNDDATLTVVDPLFGFGGTKLLALVQLPGPGADWALTPDGKKIFVSIPATGEVAVVDTATWKLPVLVKVGATPGRVALQPDAHYAWIATATGVTVLATDRATVAAQIPLGAGPHDLVFSADSRRAFVTNPAARTLAVIDIPTLTKTLDLPLDATSAGLVYSATSDAVYLIDSTAGAILVVDAAKPAVVARLAAEPGLAEIALAPGGRFAFVANPARDTVSILDAATNRLIQHAKIDGAPEQIAFSGDMAFVRRRASPVVAMIPLKEIGREGAAIPVAETTGGEAPFGARTSLAAGIVQAPGEAAVVIANPKDKAVYYYMEGMAAPMGNFGNYDRAPRAVLVVDRSLHEIAPGVYEAAADLPAAGDYDAVFFLDAPRIAHCFPVSIAANGHEKSSPTAALRFTLAPGSSLVAGTPARLAIQLAGASAGPLPADFEAMVMLAPGTWHTRVPLVAEADGTLVCAFTPPQPGVYQIFLESPSLGLAFNRTAPLLLRATEP